MFFFKLGSDTSANSSWASVAQFLKPSSALSTISETAKSAKCNHSNNSTKPNSSAKSNNTAKLARCAVAVMS